MILELALSSFVACAQTAEPTPSYHLSEQERAAIDAAIDRSAEWLVAELRRRSEQTRVGGEGAGRGPTSPVLQNTMVLWTLAEARSPRIDAFTGFEICGRVLAHRQPDGGVYAARSGLEMYECMAAEAALSAYHRRHPASDMDSVLPPIRRAIATMLISTIRRPVGLSDTLDALNGQRADWTEGERGALRFLKGAGVGRATNDPSAGPRRLEERRPYIFEALGVEHPLTRRAHAVIAGLPSISEARKEVIGLHGEATTLPPEPEVQFSRVSVATWLARTGDPMLVRADGTRIDWPRELVAATLVDRRDPGVWDSSGESWRTDRLLVTCYAIRTLALCRDVRSANEGR